MKSDALRDAILTSARLALMVTEPDGIIQLFNSGAERLLGYSAVEVVNRVNAVDVHDPLQLLARTMSVCRELSTAISANFEALTCKAFRGAEDSFESTLIHKNGKPLPLGVSITALRDEVGCIVGYMVILTDLPPRKPVGRELDSASSSDLLARMSHEMRTPLSAILGFAQLMESGTPAPTGLQRRNIDRILQAGWYLENLFNVTRDLALLESGSLSLSADPVPLAAVMLDCRAITERQAIARGVRMTFPQVEPTCVVSADRNRLHQVLATLLSAAIEYGDADGAVAVSCESHNTHDIRIGITYEGDELASERLTRLFHTLTDGEQQADGPEGAGIGLRLVRRLVGSMGGTIEPPHDGTKRLISFNLKRVPVHAPAAGTATHSAFGRDMTFTASDHSLANVIPG